VSRRRKTVYYIMSLPPPILPTSSPTEPQGTNYTDTTSGVIPYKNPSALIAYYLGLFSIFPVLGIGLGITALVLGIKGIKFNKEHPEAKGKAHAGIGIGCGVFGLLLNLLIVGILLTAFLSTGRK
jgi:hypothetical protein